MADPATIYLKDWLTLFALLLGPLFAVWLTLHHQDRVQKRTAKERLFLILMAHRKSNPPTADWASALNLIDVVFADNSAVVARWHTLYAVLEMKPWNDQRFNHAHLELMSEMAKVPGYRSLSQTDIDKFYLPEAHGNAAALQAEVQQNFLRVLKASKNFAEPKND